MAWEAQTAMLTRIWTMLETDRQTVRTTNHSTVADLMNKLDAVKRGRAYYPGPSACVHMWAL